MKLFHEDQVRDLRETVDSMFESLTGNTTRLGVLLRDMRDRVQVLY